MSFSSPEQQRSILALCFEPNGDDYLYYRNRWSRGNPVTASEREAYLNIPAMGSRHAWRSSLGERETLPPRPAMPVRKKLLAAMPIWMALMGLAFGIFGVLDGLTEANTIIAIIYVLGGCLMCFFGGSIIIAKITHRRSSTG